MGKVAKAKSPATLGEVVYVQFELGVGAVCNYSSRICLLDSRGSFERPFCVFVLTFELDGDSNLGIRSRVHP